MSSKAQSLILDLIAEHDKNHAKDDLEDFDVFLPPGTSMTFDDGEEEEM